MVPGEAVREQMAEVSWVEETDLLPQFWGLPIPPGAFKRAQDPLQQEAAKLRLGGAGVAAGGPTLREPLAPWSPSPA